MQWLEGNQLGIYYWLLLLVLKLGFSCWLPFFSTHSLSHQCQVILIHNHFYFLTGQADIPGVWFSCSVFPFILWEVSFLSFSSISNAVPLSPSQLTWYSCSMTSLRRWGTSQRPQRRNAENLGLWSDNLQTSFLSSGKILQLCMDPLKKEINPGIAPFVCTADNRNSGCTER